jgi:hypothetical protein
MDRSLSLSIVPTDQVISTYSFDIGGMPMPQPFRSSRFSFGFFCQSFVFTKKKPGLQGGRASRRSSERQARENRATN